jgi:hypothetical protein
MVCNWVVLTWVFCETMSATECAAAVTLTLMAMPLASSIPPTYSSNMNGSTMANSIAARASLSFQNVRTRNDRLVTESPPTRTARSGKRL